MHRFFYLSYARRLYAGVAFARRRLAYRGIHCLRLPHELLLSPFERIYQIIRTEFLSRSTRLSQSLPTIESLTRLGGVVQDTMSVLKAFSCRTTLTTFQDWRMSLFVVLWRRWESRDAEGVGAKKVDLPLCPLYAGAKTTPLLIAGWGTKVPLHCIIYIFGIAFVFLPLLLEC